MTTTTRPAVTQRGRETTRLALAARDALAAGSPATDELAALWDAVYPLVRFRARKTAFMVHEGSRVALGLIDDLVQEGAALIPGTLARYDPGQGEFTSYLVLRLTRLLRRAGDRLESPVRVSEYARESAKYASARRSPALARAAEAMDRSRFGEVDDRVHEIVGADDPAGAVERADFQAAAMAAWSGLPALPRKVLGRLYGLDGRDPETAEAIGAKLGRSKSTIYTDRDRALAALRAELGADDAA
jgi:RNA polymerase sigma factor (sigma-70 family)